MNHCGRCSFSFPLPERAAGIEAYAVVLLDAIVVALGTALLGSMNDQFGFTGFRLVRLTSRTCFECALRLRSLATFYSAFSARS